MFKHTVTLVLIAFNSLAYSQGIFDINSPITTTSKAAIVESDGFGESSFYTKKQPNGDLNVRYVYKKDIVPNPLFITYAYEIEALPSGDFALDMQAALPPLSMYIDTNAIRLTYAGDKIILPNYPKDKEEFPDTKGTFTLKLLATNDTLLTYNVTVTNRKFVNKGNILLNGKNYESYLHTYDFIQYTFLDGYQLIHKTQDAVEETYLAGCGLVNQKRQGSVTFFNEGEAQVMEGVLISELLNIR
jgi:hypothetical protein